MPVIYHHSDNEREIAVWQAEEGLSYFAEALASAGVSATAGMAVKHPEKRLQWLASRHLLEILYPAAAQYYRGRKPFLRNGPFVSFSHSGNLAGVMLSRCSAGLDVQFPEKKLSRIAAKFTDPQELSRTGIADELKALTVVWAVKEAVFKTYGTLLPFRDIHISGFDPETEECSAEVSRKGRRHLHRVRVTDCAGAVVAFLTE